MTTRGTPTPGPWKVGAGGNNRVYGPDNAGDDSGLIAVVYKGRANMDLIAAAPDMKAALEAIRRDPHGCPQCHSGKIITPGKSHWDECGYRLLETALAKAEGSTPTPGEQG